MLHVLIPARGGSVRLKYKNLTELDGMPLVARTIQLVQATSNGMIPFVSTDDDTIHCVAELHGAIVDRSFPHSGASTVDQLAEHYRIQAPGSDLLLVQPTVVGLTPAALRSFIVDSQGLAHPSAVAAPASHITYLDGQQITERFRVEGRIHREIGVRYYPAGSDGPLQPWVSSVPVIDIDTPDDMEAARTMVEELAIHFDIVIGRSVGMGHVYRSAELMRHLQRHHIEYRLIDVDATPEVYRAAERALDGLGYRLSPDVEPAADVIVSDQLDTNRYEMAALLTSAPVVAIEDAGEGERLATVSVDPLRRHGDLQYFTIAPEFAGLPERTERGEGVLITFGGTDPSHLTELVAAQLSDRDDVTIIEPPGRPIASSTGRRHLVQPVMVNQLRKARLVICSAGRTALEATAVGTPALVFTQNIKEATHTHIQSYHGHVAFGMGVWAGTSTIGEMVFVMMEDNSTWDLYHRGTVGKVDGRGTHRLARLIERVGRREA